DDADVAGDEQGARKCRSPQDDALRALRQPMLLQRAFTTNALTGNPQTNDLVVFSGLTTKTYDVNDFLNNQLDDNDTRLFFRYLYRCAAPAGATLAWASHRRLIKETFTGAFGLCPGWA